MMCVFFQNFYVTEENITSSEMVDKNAVSMLKEHHDRFAKIMGAEPPKYEESMSDINQFVTICQYMGLKSRGQDTSKKKSKTAAAVSMLKQLGLIYSYSGGTQSKSPTDEVNLLLQRNNTSTSVKKPNSIDTDHALAMMSRSEINSAEEFLNKYVSKDVFKEWGKQFWMLKESHEFLSSGLEVDFPKSNLIYKDYDNVIEHFTKVMEDLKLKFNIEFPELKDGKKEVVALIKMEYKCLVQQGIGMNQHQAVKQVCKNALELISILSRN